jgi:hypothetical protein
MSSRAAAAMYPNLARAEDNQQRVQTTRVSRETQPAWGKSDHPLYAEPRRAPRMDLSKLVRVRK